MLFKEKYLKLIDIIFLLVSFIFLLCLSFLLRKTLSFNELLFITLSFVLVIFVIFQIYRRLSKYFEYLINFKNKEIVDKLNSELNKLSGEILAYSFNLNIPPIFSQWSIDGDLLKIIIDNIYNIEKNNINILELGSGVSTIILSKVLSKLNKGKIHSIEHDRIFYEKTKRILELNKLDNLCDFIYSPIEELYINEKKWLWYNKKFLGKIDNIDILLIDGPPAYIQEMSRFPALPILINKLNDDIVIYLDDGNRDDEKKIVREWQKLYLTLKIQYINTTKGLWVITK